VVARLVWSKSRTVTSVDALIARIPADDPAYAQARDRARSFAQDCGCSMGATFMAVAMAVAIVRWIIVPSFEPAGALYALGSVVTAAVVGKAVGLALARVRLSLLQRSLAREWQG
jgi:multidrug efflux pump subunit AcrB